MSPETIVWALAPEVAATSRQSHTRIEFKAVADVVLRDEQAFIDLDG